MHARAQVQELCEAANAEVAADEAVVIANFLCNGNYAVSGGLQGIQARLESWSMQVCETRCMHASWHSACRSFSRGYEQAVECWTCRAGEGGNTPVRGRRHAEHAA